VLDPSRNKSLHVEAVDVPPSAARSLSLLLVAAALLPAHLGVKEAVDSTVRAALRLRGMKASTELRRLEDAIVVLENDAKDYGGKHEVFSSLLDATLAGELVEVQYRSPQDASFRRERFYSATIGLYRGGLYTLAVGENDSGENPVWRALERIETSPKLDAAAPKLEAGVRLRALREAKRRWGPARPRPAEDEQLITLHFSERVAPYVQARPWHPLAETEVWPASEGGGVRMAIRLAGETAMFESWVRSWGPEVQVLRPREMAERIADSFESAAKKHRAAALEFEESLQA
jgi:predicted DNA-binding transcriptional regulator YafY